MMKTKTDKEIMEILHLPTEDEFSKIASKEACTALNEQMIKVFKIGYRYGLVANAGELLDISLSENKIIAKPTK